MAKFFSLIVFLAFVFCGCVVRPTEKRIVFIPYTAEQLKANAAEKEKSAKVKIDTIASISVAEVPHDSVVIESIVPAASQANSSQVLRFHLIAGSFNNFVFAKQYQSKLIAQGYKSVIVEVDSTQSSSAYRVTFFSFATRSEATLEKERQQASGPFNQTWILESQP